MRSGRARTLLFAIFAAAASAGCNLGTTSGLTVWAVSDTREIGPDSQPTPESEVYSSATRTVRLSAAINETVAFQLGLRGGAAASGPYTVNLSDLSSARGSISSRQFARVYCAHWVRVEDFRSWYPEHVGRSATATRVADILVPWEAPRGGGPLRLDTGENSVIWFDVHVPPTTEPGDYSGTIEVTSGAAGRSAWRGVVTVRVLPVVVPAERSLAAICRVDARSLLATHLNWPVDTAEQTRLMAEEPSHQAAVRLVDATVRLLAEHRAAPVLWNCFPKFRVTEQRSVEIDWRPYDAIVARWLDGSAFSDRVPLAVWPVPASEAYPEPARNGGFDSPRFARVLAAYLAECQRHFAERGWDQRAFARLSGPGELSAERVEQARRLTGIARQSETRVPLVTHLPPRTLRTLGWHDAPNIDLPDVALWAPPAGWWESEVLLRERGLGRQVWFAPGAPPFSGSLNVEAPASDARELAWQAARYGLESIWIENAAEVGRPASPRTARHPEALLYPGVEFGLTETPVASARLKRLRRGLLDYEFIRLLERRGKALLAQRTAEQLVRWAFCDAAGANLLTTREAGFALDPYAYWLARELLLSELARDEAAAGGDEAGESQIRLLADWSRLTAQTSRVALTVRGVRLESAGGNVKGRVFAELTNGTDRAISGKVALPAPPVGWSVLGEPRVSVSRSARGAAALDLELRSLSYNVSGAYPFAIALESDDAGTFEWQARLAIAACPQVEVAPRLDGDLADWAITSSNAAGDFRLVRGRGPVDISGVASGQPRVATQAFFCCDREKLYVAVFCALAADEQPLWSADNAVPIDGAIPWGQDVVEILLSPKSAAQGAAGDIYCLQVKPSGLVVGRKGCLTDPPIGPSVVWQHNAEAVLKTRREAWIVEIAIPLASFDSPAADSRIWGANVARLDARRGEYSSWSGARGHCYAQEALGNLVFTSP